MPIQDLLSLDEEVLAGAAGPAAGADFAPSPLALSPLSEEEVDSLDPNEGAAEEVAGGAFLLLL